MTVSVQSKFFIRNMFYLCSRFPLSLIFSTSRLSLVWNLFKTDFGFPPLPPVDVAKKFGFFDDLHTKWKYSIKEVVDRKKTQNQIFLHILYLVCYCCQHLLLLQTTSLLCQKLNFSQVLLHWFDIRCLWLCCLDVTLVHMFVVNTNQDKRVRPKDHIYRMVIVEGRCTMARSSSLWANCSLVDTKV